jgi:hypothetical protein
VGRWKYLSTLGGVVVETILIGGVLVAFILIVLIGAVGMVGEVARDLRDQTRRIRFDPLRHRASCPKNRQPRRSQ